MKHNLATVSFSVDLTIKQELDKLAASEGRTKSDLFKEMFNYYQFRSSLRHLQDQGTIIAARLGLETDDDVYEYLSETA